MDIFERAARSKLRFDSIRGQLTTEDLWDLPLTASSRATRDVKVDLDTIARSISATLRSIGQDSFVEMKPDPRKPTLELQLDILKHIIASKVSDAQAAETRAAKAEQRRILTEALAEKESEEVGKMSKEEILAKLAELN